jgi:hypothetical protein
MRQTSNRKLTVTPWKGSLPMKILPTYFNPR